MQSMNITSSASSSALGTSYEIIIIGAGPAGLSAATELITSGIDGKKILILDMGPDVSARIEARGLGRDDYNTSGLGGAGLFSDGKLAVVSDHYSLFPSDRDIVGLWEALPNNEITEEETKILYRYAYDIFDNLNIGIQKTVVTEERIQEMQKRFAEASLHFEYYESRQVEPLDLPKLISNLKSRLEAAGVNFSLGTRVLEVDFDPEKTTKHVRCNVHNNEFNLECIYLIFAVGKRGMKWVVEQAGKLGIKTKFRPIQLGVRVEVPTAVLLPFTTVHRDLQLIRKVNENTLVQTFCTCSGGRVALCPYDDLVVLGGYTDHVRTSNTNFALLVKLNVPDIDALAYGYSVVQTANILGNGKPLVQRLGDLRRGVITTSDDIARNPVQPTLNTYELNDISKAFPKFIISAILDTLEDFDKVMHGVNQDTTIISAPCLEFCYQKIVVNRYMESNISDVYISGDVAGYESGIIPAAASGILAARGILRKLNGTSHRSNIE